MSTEWFTRGTSPQPEPRLALESPIADLSPFDQTESPDQFGSDEFDFDATFEFHDQQEDQRDGEPGGERDDERDDKWDDERDDKWDDERQDYQQDYEQDDEHEDGEYEVDEGPDRETELVVEEPAEQVAGPAFGEESAGLIADFSALVRQGMASAAVLAALATGEQDEGRLTNRVFAVRHPELGGRAIRPDEPALAAEWLKIRDQLVRPLIARWRGRSAPTAAAGPSSQVKQRMRTQQLRDAWAAYAGRKDLMREADILRHHPPVNPQTVEAFAALGRALAAAGYTANGVGGFSKRKIKAKIDGRIQETDRWSLHSYGLAIDIDARHNPHRHGNPGPARWSTASTPDGRRADVAAGRADTSFTPEQIAAAEAIRTVDGHRVFFWAGHWRTSPDAMHFQIDVTPDELSRGLAPPRASETVEESFVFDALKALWRKPTVGFEFDVHYGILPALLPVGVPMPAPGATVSDHTWGTDGFKVKRDGSRLEINTRPFETTPGGKTELRQTITRITTFAEELASGCRNATPSPIVIPGVTGAPRPFLHPRIAGIPIVKLPISGAFTNCSVWAAPQATVTIPLAKVATLVQRIKASEGRGAGKALSGGSSARMGVRSEALYRALREVRRARSALAFSDDVEGLLILLASYLWTSELPYRFPAPNVPARPGEDYEPFGKSYLPINVKTPFSQIFSTLLSAADQRVFRDRFADGAARANLFRLALPNGATLTDGDRVLLPTGPMDGGVSAVHTRQATEFGRVPTWNDLVEHTLDAIRHGWGDRLLVPLSTHLDVGQTRPRVALELRRIGFASVDRSLWPGLMAAVFEMTRDLSR